MHKMIQKITVFALMLVLAASMAASVGAEEAEQKKNPYLGIPWYFQEDCADMKYAGETMDVSGSSVTALAMVASYLRGEEILPKQVASQLIYSDAALPTRLENGATLLDLSFTRISLWDDVVNSLHNGEYLILMTNSKSEFADREHYLVLEGITEDGRIQVIDPRYANYSNPDLTDGYQNGFAQEELAQYFERAWSFRLYQAPEGTEPRYPFDSLSEEDRLLLAKLIWLEARGEEFEGQQAVAEVVFNRMVSERFQPETVCGTIMAKGQFGSVGHLDEAKPEPIQFKAIDRVLSGDNVLSMDVLFYATRQVNRNVWGTIGKHVFCYAPN